MIKMKVWSIFLCAVWSNQFRLGIIDQLQMREWYTSNVWPSLRSKQILWDMTILSIYLSMASLRQIMKWWLIFVLLSVRYWTLDLRSPLMCYIYTMIDNLFICVCSFPEILKYNDQWPYSVLWLKVYKVNPIYEEHWNTLYFINIETSLQS